MRIISCRHLHPTLEPHWCNHMDDYIQRRSSASASPSMSSSLASGNKCRRLKRRHSVDDAVGDKTVACTGESCQSCTAGVIADCVAMCCCPCAVVSILALAFVKLPWAVARRCLRGGRRRRRLRRLEEERKCRDGGSDVTSPIWGAGDETTSVGVFGGGVNGEMLNDHFSAEFTAEDVWLEMYEDSVGHLGFGRVSFSGQG